MYSTLARIQKGRFTTLVHWHEITMASTDDTHYCTSNFQRQQCRGIVDKKTGDREENKSNELLFVLHSKSFYIKPRNTNIAAMIVLCQSRVSGCPFGREQTQWKPVSKYYIENKREKSRMRKKKKKKRDVVTFGKL